jgi:hypothetical protein
MGDCEAGNPTKPAGWKPAPCAAAKSLDQWDRPGGKAMGSDMDIRHSCAPHRQGDEPSSTTLSGSRAWVSASHRSITVPDQPGTSWISSSTSRAPTEDSLALRRAKFHCCSGHEPCTTNKGFMGAATAFRPCIMAMNLMFCAADGTSAVRGGGSWAVMGAGVVKGATPDLRSAGILVPFEVPSGHGADKNVRAPTEGKPGWEERGLRPVVKRADPDPRPSSPRRSRSLRRTERRANPGFSRACGE